jgi:hypothetical protein
LIIVKQTTKNAVKKGGYKGVRGRCLYALGAQATLRSVAGIIAGARMRVGAFFTKIALISCVFRFFCGEFYGFRIDKPAP